MDTVTCIKSRRSVRRFLPDPVPKEVLEEVVSVAAWTPSWKNTQTSHYYAVTDPALLARIAEECVMGFAGNAKIITTAPILIIQGITHGRSGFERDGSYSTSKEDRWEVFDAGAAAQTLCLAAWKKGLGTVIMGIFDEKKLKDVLSLPENVVIGSLIAIGYPAIEPPAPDRKPLEKLLFWL